MPDLRKAFWKEMETIASEDKDVIVITGDLGFSFYEEYAKKFPKQFLNAGCIEQSMIGIAAGMARMGKKPYVYSGALFALLRPYEQVRDDIAYNNTNVRIIGTGAAMFLGFTHNFGPDENERKLLDQLPIGQEYPTNEEDLAKALHKDGPLYIRL